MLSTSFCEKAKTHLHVGLLKKDFPFPIGFSINICYNTNSCKTKFIQKEHRAYGAGTSLFSILRPLDSANTQRVFHCPIFKVSMIIKYGISRISIFQKAGSKMGSWHNVARFEKTLLPHRESPTPVKKSQNLHTKYCSQRASKYIFPGQL